MTEYVDVGGLRVARELDELVREDIAPGTGIGADTVWKTLADIVTALGPRNKALLAKRDEIQARIDQWLKARAGSPLDGVAYREFLESIGYLVPEGEPFEVTTGNIDPEIATLAGPQLVVPVDKARYALNAANARWGSLYDALYGTDVIPQSGDTKAGGGYDPVRGDKVIAWTNDFLEEAVPLADGAWSSVSGFGIAGSVLELSRRDGPPTTLADPAAFVGFRGEPTRLEAVLLRHHGLHIELEIDPEHPIGRQHAAGVRDVVLESAVTTIIDCEDSVAAVDAEDKTLVYANWNGIMRGVLTTRFEKGGNTIERRLEPDRIFTAATGSELVLPGRSLLLVRHIGAHVETDAVTTAKGEPIPETFLDCVITTLAAMHDLNGTGRYRNSRTGSIYAVKPKQHGPEEVALSVELFALVEAAFGLPKNTLKIGIMDEERRTTVNLAECIRAASERVIFINTGFLDRTGDEIHTHMEAAPMIPKPEIKSAPWMLAYEDWNVDVGLATGLPGHAQIGKGMWAMPAEMAQMLDAKIGHPRAGASCAWVPSPTAATLHAVHYHRVDVGARQHELEQRARASLADILTPPLLLDRKLGADEIRRELDNNAQGILGYVVRWVEQGVGCSTVPDINNVGLMEDRATLRISSQHIANWLHHGLLDEAEVTDALKRMAKVVDAQNAGDPAYRNIAPDYDSSIAFTAALDLVFAGRRQPNGYTEHLLIERRKEFKARLARP
ncbi:MAG TPA: malate synthase G [Gammaproteobacteria bacterium]|nr:malate synthase G [Gammaproteobacteria bacterium]